MINQTKLKDFISRYKKYLQNHYDDEINKLKAIKHFQNYWNIDAVDFSSMFNDSLLSLTFVFDDKGNNTNNEIFKFSSLDSLTVREMFNNLFDERLDVKHRIEKFEGDYLFLNSKYNNTSRDCLVTKRTISTYLWLRYPSKYYIYVYDDVKSVAEQLQWFSTGDMSYSISSSMELYDSIRSEILSDEDLIHIYNELWDDDCYEDFQALTLTSSIAEYIKRHPSVDSSIKLSNKILNMDENSELNVCENEFVDPDKKHYWWLTANPNIWSFSDLPVGKVQWYTLYNEYGHKRRIFQNFLDAKPGDAVICYEGTPIKKIVALAVIDKENDGNKLSFRKVESLSYPIELAVLKNYKELENMEYMKNPLGSFFKVEDEEYDFLMDVIREFNPIIQNNVNVDKYGKDNFLVDVYVTDEEYDSMIEVLKNKKNIILQGAPGVGKTFTAKRLCYSIMEKKDDSRIEFVQFHQNYSYEDFVMGWRPEGSEFKLSEGIFYRFCKRAEADLEQRPYFFIIDEINRGNMSKIFGELLMLLERDYRGTKITLAYNGLKFSVPENLYLIGMMNTADRSLAMIDYALRRRFAFIDMEPAFDSSGFRQYQKKLDNKSFDLLIEEVKSLNQEIAQDRSLGKGFMIGHSYFCGAKDCNNKWLKSIIRFDILPMLSEYWFDEPQKVDKWKNRFMKVFND